MYNTVYYKKYMAEKESRRKRPQIICASTFDLAVLKT